MHYYIPLSLQFHGRLPVCTLFSPNPEYLILIPKHQKEKKKRKEKCVQKYSTPILTHNLQNVVPQQAESISSPPNIFSPFAPGHLHTISTFLKSSLS